MTKVFSTKFSAFYGAAADGSVTVVISVMPEQLLRFQFWADEVEVPLDRFMREAAEMICGQLADHVASQPGDEYQLEDMPAMSRLLN